ncbi:TcmI family type II polyketide cyclase [Amycolatopsis sp. cmx-4-83]|uniref:TcmI family type II polyketide cyclase n=1 Tax=Amycolatopsis sp. cmx-4-83 TaxID=2790940 RepID=UPI00397E18AB
MFSTLIVARMETGHAGSVAEIFTDFDESDLPHRMGTRRRELFRFHGLYFHVQDFEEVAGGENIEAAKADPRFVQVSKDLRPFIDPYDPGWQSPKDAIAERFYHWEAKE